MRASSICFYVYSLQHLPSRSHFPARTAFPNFGTFFASRCVRACVRARRKTVQFLGPKNGPVFRTEKLPRYSPASERPKSGSIFRTEKRDRFRCQKVAPRSRIFWQQRYRKSGRGARRGLTFSGWGLAQNWVQEIAPVLQITMPFRD